MSCPTNENDTQPQQVEDSKDVDMEGPDIGDSEEEDFESDSEEVTPVELKELDDGLSRLPGPGTLVRSGATIDLTIDTSLSGDEDFWDLIKLGY